MYWSPIEFIGVVSGNHEDKSALVSTANAGVSACQLISKLPPDRSTDNEGKSVTLIGLA
jgi:hypothetical protein